MGHDVRLFDFMGLLMQHGESRMNELLIEEVKSQRPKMIFTYLLGDEIHLETLLSIKGNGISSSPILVGYFGDDEWRYDNWSSKYGPGYHWVVTTDPEAVAKYRRQGVKAIFKRTGANHHIFNKKGLPRDIDISFVGGARLERVSVIKRLRQDGITVSPMGIGWELSLWDRIKGKIRQKFGIGNKSINAKSGKTWLGYEEMAEVFERSRINLNFAGSFRGKRQQIKARVFEVTASGGFLLTEYCPEIESEKHFIPGKEIACFENYQDMVAKIKYYLAHETEREAIAEAGYRRAMAEHTSEMRMRQVLAEIGC
jgi:spore maturation protein CgeB